VDLWLQCVNCIIWVDNTLIRIHTLWKTNFSIHIRTLQNLSITARVGGIFVLTACDIHVVFGSLFVSFFLKGKKK
jgi:hypothetical protein